MIYAIQHGNKCRINGTFYLFVDFENRNFKKNNPLPGSRGYCDLFYSLIQAKPKPYQG